MNRAERRGFGSRVFDIFNHTFLLVLGLSCIIPLIHLLALSFSDRAAATGGLVTLWPVRPTPITYEKVLEAGVFLNAFWISVIRTAVGTTLQMILIVLISFPLSKSKEEMPFRNIIMGSVVFAYLFNGGLIPWFLVIRKLGMLNTIWALIIPQALPLWNVILMMNFFRRVPKELEEASIIDGATYWQILLHVYLPISVPALATLTLFGAVGHWNAWFDGMILIADRDLIPLQTFLRTVVVKMDMNEFMRNPEDFDMFSDRSLRAAQTLVTVVPILVVYPFLQRYFVSGITLGALKG
ncbi:MAG: carbohydrate ABC transporter permease [Caldilineaceae bacterium SB0670_bin_27]|uniref:Carbohydrate ABC transporter permease n=1 Tax=Caldilineaceae bacterium SB0664_bin_27 TaxID=2605260 RepID=A0A6B0YRX2_9CHLR|nr:carbohydrate ABC transporter permease [Caldilineaceae bacterium SB0664_bin_27]MYJ79508.1 carbohydrate ABC transporter permease [Caldilineaceae bacterium SB0670_bin_27]